jgi:hypothetical protein
VFALLGWKPVLCSFVLGVKIRVLWAYILMISVGDRSRNRMVTIVYGTDFYFNFLVDAIWIFKIVPKYFKFAKFFNDVLGIASSFD